nr:MAG TPA: hypothetical protein [Bacteriophage sp.]
MTSSSSSSIRRPEWQWRNRMYVFLSKADNAGRFQEAAVISSLSIPGAGTVP